MSDSNDRVCGCLFPNLSGHKASDVPHAPSTHYGDDDLSDPSDRPTKFTELYEYRMNRVLRMNR